MHYLDMAPCKWLRDVHLFVSEIIGHVLVSALLSSVPRTVEDGRQVCQDLVTSTKSNLALNKVTKM